MSEVCIRNLEKKSVSRSLKSSFHAMIHFPHSSYFIKLHFRIMDLFTTHSMDMPIASNSYDYDTHIITLRGEDASQKFLLKISSVKVPHLQYEEILIDMIQNFTKHTFPFIQSLEWKMHPTPIWSSNTGVFHLKLIKTSNTRSIFSSPLL